MQCNYSATLLPNLPIYLVYLLFGKKSEALYLNPFCHQYQYSRLTRKQQLCKLSTCYSLVLVESQAREIKNSPRDPAPFFIYCCSLLCISDRKRLFAVSHRALMHSQITLCKLFLPFTQNYKVYCYEKSEQSIAFVQLLYVQLDFGLPLCNINLVFIQIPKNGSHFTFYLTLYKNVIRLVKTYPLKSYIYNAIASLLQYILSSPKLNFASQSNSIKRRVFLFNDKVYFAGQWMNGFSTTSRVLFLNLFQKTTTRAKILHIFKPVNSQNLRGHI